MAYSLRALQYGNPSRITGPTIVAALHDASPENERDVLFASALQQKFRNLLLADYDDKSDDTLGRLIKNPSLISVFDGRTWLNRYLQLSEWLRNTTLFHVSV